MSPVIANYAALEAVGTEAQREPPGGLASDPHTFNEDYGPHCRLTSAFAWHPLLRRDLTLPPITLFLLAWFPLAYLVATQPVPQPWGDEAFTWQIIQLPYLQMLERLGNDLHPPLYFALVQQAYGAGFQEFFSLRVLLFFCIALPLGALPLLVQAWPPVYRKLGAIVGWILVLWPLQLYLVQLRYYGLLALFIATGVVALGNVLDGSKSSRGWWSALAVVAFALAAMTNYQAYAVWALAVVAATWLGRARLRASAMLVPHVLALLLTIVLSPSLRGGGSQLRDAATSPFASGFTNVIVELIARLGVGVLAWWHGEFIALWWVALFWIGMFVLLWRLPRYQQSGLSDTAKLCLVVGGGMAMLMALLTSGPIPVGVEFFPARIVYCFPLLSLGLAEWYLRRTNHLRWFGVLLVCNFLAIGAGLQAASVAIRTPAPASPTPFLHATYLTPTPALLLALREVEERYREFPLFVIEDVGTRFALRGADWDAPSDTVLMLEYSPADIDWTDRALVAALTSTRDLSPSGERESWERFFEEHCTLQEERMYLHEDPLWLRVKRLLLRRDVRPHKKSLRVYRVDSAPRD